jgi:transposase
VKAESDQASPIPHILLYEESIMEAGKRAVGIDLAKKTMEVRFMKDGEKIKAWNGKTDVVGREKLYAQLTRSDIVGIEACGLAFVIAREIEQKTEAEVVVLNPGRLAIIYRSTKKTDSEDAMKIARLLLRYPKEELPIVPIPSDREEEERALVKELGFLKAERTKFINRLHSRFVACGITTIVKADLKTESKRNASVELLFGIYLGEAKRILLMIDTLENQIDHLESEQIKALNENELTPYIMSVPGVGPSFALAFLAYVGDGSRFSMVELLFVIVKKKCYYWEMDAEKLNHKLKFYKLNNFVKKEGSAA